jgi:hypothetical protein
MSKWTQTLKRSLLAAVAVVLAFAWSDTGRAQSGAPCLVERGQDPLDVLNSGIRHNVWLLLDTSGSMNSSPASGGAPKIQQAKDALNRVMSELVDGAGRPLVNWGFVHYARNAATTDRCPAIPPDANGDKYPDNPGGCPGVNTSSFVNPGSCSDDSRPEVRTVLDGISSGSGTTPIGITFSQLSSYMVGDGSVAGNTTNFVSGLLPNQKNFIIQITDGEDTCECDTGGYPGDGLSPLLSPVTMRPDPVNPDIVVSSTDAQDFSAFNAGLKAEFALKQIDPSLDGSKGNIFVVGFDLGTDPAAQQRVATIAWMGGGANLVPQRARNLMPGPFFTENQTKLVNDLRDILARIGIPATEVTLGPPVVASVKEVIHSHTDTFLDRQDVIPASLTDPDEIREARIARADHRDNVEFTTSVEVPGFRGHLRARNIYQVTDETQPRTAREADFTEIWDAGAELQDDDPDARVLFFNRRNATALLPFNTSTVTPADLGVSAGYLGALTDEDARDIVVQVMRGYRLVLDPITRSPYDSTGQLNFSPLDAAGNPTWKLFESVGGVGVLLNPPRSPDFDPPLNHASDYGVGGSVAGEGFYWDHFNRSTLVLYSSNAGILHAFDAETGAERLGYIPDDAMSLAPGETPGSRDTLKDFVQLVVTENNNVINHRYSLASSPNLEDVFLRGDNGGDDRWHSLVAVGRGRGGRFLTMLDFTDAAASPNNLRLLWNRGNREGIADGSLDGLGETWSIPVFGNVDTRSTPSQTGNRIDQWLVFAGGGYGCDNAQTEGQFLFAFRVEDGFVYHRAPVTSDPAAAIPTNALPAAPTIFNPHQEDASDNKDFVTRVYIPDIQGRVWKLNTTDPDPTQWTMNVFAEMGLEHPITAAVTLLMDTFQPNRVFVVAGSGGDRRAPIPPGGFKLRIWIDNDADGSNTTQYAAGDSPQVETVFNPEERMFVQAVTTGQIGDPTNLAPAVTFAATREDFEVATCAIAFHSTLYAESIETGLPLFDLDTTQPGTSQTALGESKVQGLFVRDGNLYVSESGGLGGVGSVSVWGDNTFDDDPAPAGIGQFTLQLLIEGFRISPF